MQYRNIQYEYNEWTTYSGKKASGYSCEHFNFAPYHISSFGTQTEAEMQERIDDYLDNRAKYERIRKWKDASCESYYNEKAKTPGSYTGD